jgi:hypothetical protein
MAQTNSTSYPQKLSRLNFFSRWEAAELPKLLMLDEQVLGVLSGFYQAGTAILCVTSKRLLLVDKKLLRLNFEDVRFEYINEVNYSHQMFLGSVKFFYGGKTLHFRSWYMRELRTLAQFVQHKMFEVTQQQRQQTENRQTTNFDGKYAPVYSGQLLSDLPQESAQHLSQASLTTNEQLEKMLQERIARWRRATRFVDTITTTRSASQGEG